MFREATRRAARDVERRRGGHDIPPPRAHDQDDLAFVVDARHFLLCFERLPARDQFQARFRNVEETRARPFRRVARRGNRDDPFLPSPLDAPLDARGAGVRGIRRELAQGAGARGAGDLRHVVEEAERER